MKTYIRNQKEKTLKVISRLDYRGIDPEIFRGSSRVAGGVDVPMGRFIGYEKNFKTKIVTYIFEFDKNTEYSFEQWIKDIVAMVKEVDPFYYEEL